MAQKQESPKPPRQSATGLHTPACTCTKDGESCATCRAYDQAGRGLEQAAAGLRALEGRL